MADAQLKLHVTICGNSFDAEGPQEDVRIAYDLFLAHLPEQMATEDQKPAPAESKREDGRTGTEPIGRDLMDRVYSRNARGLVTLRVLPHDGETRVQDSAILIMYGYRALLDSHDVQVTRLNEGLRDSGITVERLDRFMVANSPLYRRGGVRSGGRYTLTTQGVQYAERLLKTILD